MLCSPQRGHPWGFFLLVVPPKNSHPISPRCPPCAWGHGDGDGDGVGDGTCSTHHAQGRCLQHPSRPTWGPRTLSSTPCPLLAASPLLVHPVADPTAGISLREKDLEAVLPKQLRGKRPPGFCSPTLGPTTGLPAVIATMRDLSKKGKLEEAAGPALGTTLSIQRLDVCSDSSVAECLSSIPGGRVDVLGEQNGVRGGVNGEMGTGIGVLSPLGCPRSEQRRRGARGPRGEHQRGGDEAHF